MKNKKQKGQLTLVSVPKEVGASKVRLTSGCPVDPAIVEKCRMAIERKRAVVRGQSSIPSNWRDRDAQL